MIYWIDEIIISLVPMIDNVQLTLNDVRVNWIDGVWCGVIVGCGHHGVVVWLCCVRDEQAAEIFHKRYLPQTSLDLNVPRTLASTI